MKWSSFKYLCKQGWRNMVANRLMTIASFGVLIACLVITGIAGLLSLNVNSFVSYLQNQNEMVIFIKDGAPNDVVNQLANDILVMDNISECTYTTKEQAVEDMMGWLENGASVLSDFQGEDNPSNPVPASLNIKITDLTMLDDTVAAIHALIDGKDVALDINVPAELSGTLVDLKSIVTYAGWGLVGVLAIVSVVVISNTIRLTVFARRKEISIMKYVGATNMFIRMPFFVEGITVGILSGIAATGVVCAGYYGVLSLIGMPDGESTTLLHSLLSCILPLESVWLPMLGIFVLFGVFIGGTGCSSSIRKYLKV